MPTNITNQMTETQIKEFEAAFKVGIVKQLEQKGLLTKTQAAQLVAMQTRKDV